MSTFWFPRSTALSDFDSGLIQLVWGAVHFAVIAAFFLVVSLLLGFGVLVRLLPSGMRARVLPADPSSTGLAAPLLLPLAIILYTALTSTMFEVGNPRYRTPTDLLMFYTLVHGIHFFAQVRKRVRSNPT